MAGSTENRRVEFGCMEVVEDRHAPASGLTSSSPTFTTEPATTRYNASMSWSMLIRHKSCVHAAAGPYPQLIQKLRYA